MSKNYPESSSPRILALMYHRIDKTQTDPWGICVSPEHFAEQIQFLTQHFKIISVADAIEQVKAKCIIANQICITFDDGYADNFIHAKPVLETYYCPATFFIATAFTGANQAFWWDELEMIFLHTEHLPWRLSLHISGILLTYIITETDLTKEEKELHSKWKWYDAAPTSRCTIFLIIWERIRPLPDAEIQTVMVALKTWAGSSNEVFLQRLPMNAEQIRLLLQNPLFTIGLHTHSHPDLSSLEKYEQYEQMVQCKQTLFHQYDVQSYCLAYPYGRYNSSTLEAVQYAGIGSCFTTKATCIDSHSNLLELGRYQVGDWDISRFRLFIQSSWQDCYV